MRPAAQDRDSRSPKEHCIVNKGYKADAVFEGGGVRGIGLLGAVSVMEQIWSWENIAGTSAGAIVAALTAAGMNSGEVREILDRIDLRELEDRGWEDKLDQVLSLPSILRLFNEGGLGFFRSHLISIFRDFGVFEGDRFIELLEDNLPPDIRTFADLRYHGPDADDPRYRYRLRVIASDLTAKRMLVLPQDIEHFGLDPDELRISTALRMSMSIPIFFEPFQLPDKKGRTHHIVDGGILSNYPIWLFDAPPGTDPSWPTFGFNMITPSEKVEGLMPFPNEVQEIDSLPKFLSAMWDTVFSALDKKYVAERHWARTIPIDDIGVKTTDFDLSVERKNALWLSGAMAAEEFMNAWGPPDLGFARWKAEYRGDVERAQMAAIQGGASLG
jgi:NTE family protein